MPSQKSSNGRTTPKKEQEQLASLPSAPTSALEWRRAAEEGFVVELPSGKAMKVRRTMDFMAILRRGNIPNALKTIIMKAVEKGDMSQLQGIEDLDMESIDGLMGLMEEAIVAMAIEPRVQLPPSLEEWQMRHPEGTTSEYRYFADTWMPADESAIPMSFLTLEDKSFLFQLAQGGTSDLATFRAESQKSMAALSNGTGVPGAAKRTPRNPSK